MTKNKYFLAGKLSHGQSYMMDLALGDFKTLYQMCGKRADVPAQLPELPVDSSIQQNIEKVWNCASSNPLQQLKEDLGDWVASSGMPGIYRAKMEELPSLCSTVVEHYVFHRLASIVNQYKSGFNSCGGFWQVVERHCMQFLPVYKHRGEIWKELHTVSFHHKMESCWKQLQGD
ncbi:hypothetical protein AMECASPLE_021027 [Ameca splendens]|uniref:Uncharacterized protein n=1 Tax=Ameca splendens TaxID=208324 RepID=A0ABV1AA95_9TELE